MEEFFEALTGGAVWGAGFAIAAGVLGGLGQGMRPLAKRVIKGSIAVTDWVKSATEETRETFTDIYEEAKAERRQVAAAPKPSKPEPSKPAAERPVKE